MDTASSGTCVAFTYKCTPRCVRYKTGTRPCSTSGTCSRTATGACTCACRNPARNTSSRSRESPSRRPSRPPRFGYSGDRACPATWRPDPDRSSSATRRGRRGRVASASCRSATIGVTTVDAAAERWASWLAGRGSALPVGHVGSASSDGRRRLGTAAE